MDSLVDILVALIKVFPDLLGMLKEDHPVTKSVRERLPEESKSAHAARILRGTP